MKVTRDKTQSADLGNGLRLTYSDSMGYWLHFTSKDGCESGEKLDLANDWAEEILAKDFAPITITLETEDEACTLWHYLCVESLYIKRHGDESYVFPSKWEDFSMFDKLDDVYKPEKKK